MTPSATPGTFRYADALPPEARCVGETPADYRSEGHLTERRLQCIWSDDKLRPATLTTDLGETVEVRSAGRWNLEAGPDFLDAVLLVGPEKRQLIGDIEVHVRPSAWKQHHHGDDPNYSRVMAHVTYVPGPRADDALPAHVLRIALRDALGRNTGFSFDDIDLDAYPHAVIPLTPRPCAQALGDNPDRWIALLAEAGRHRLARKRQRLAAQIAQTRDARQSFYEAFMAALGYKRNSRAFRLLAQRLPLAGWLPSAAPIDHYARLLMAAGLLPDPARGQDEASRLLIRRLWDRAWRNPAPAPAAPLQWRLGAMRPANHPVRRLAVAAALFGGPMPVESLWSDRSLEPPEGWFKTVLQRLIDRAELDIWNNRLTLTRLTKATASTSLMGAAAAATLITNVIVPYVACARPEVLPALLPALPAEAISAPMRATAAHLFGRDHNPVFYAASGLLQQGLLQIHADFCLNAHSGCAQCRLAASLQG
jgi:hypothetical protein